jgi:hypothetical protein
LKTTQKISPTLIAAVLAHTFSLQCFAQTATATSTSRQVSSDLVAAQNLFLRTDYEGALKGSLVVLKKAPQNMEAKRLAAKSYRELKRFKECLRMTQSIPPQPSLNEDVILVGDCNQQEAAWTLSFFQSSSAHNASRDSALFFIGKYYYKQGDYQRSSKHLLESTVLPARLDKERTFMLERIKDVTQSAQAAQPVPAPTPNPTPEPMTPHPNNSRPNSPTGDGKNEGKKTEGRDTRDNDSSSHSAEAPHQYLFDSAKNISLSLFAGGASEFGKETPIKRGSQVNYEITVERPSNANVPTNAFRTIKTTQSTTLYPLVRTELALRLGNNKFERNQLMGFGVELSAKGEYAKRTQEYVLPNISHSYHGNLLPYRHGVFKLTPAFGIQPNKSFLISASVPVGFATTFSKYSLSESPTIAGALSAGAFRIHGDYQYSFLQGGDFKPGAHTSCYGLKLGFEKTEFLFSHKDIMHAFRFCQIRPDGSKNVVEFTELEGDFIEVNLFPQLKITNQFSLLGYFHYSNGSLGSYVSTSQAKRVEVRGKDTKKYTPFRPSSGITTSSLESSLGGKWQPNSMLSLVGKAGYRSFDTVYSEVASGGNDEAILYADLLDAGMLKKLFVGLGLQFEWNQ